MTIFSPKMLQNYHFLVQVPNVGNKTFLDTCNHKILYYVELEHMEKISEISSHGLQNMSFQIHINLFCGLAKNQATTFHKLTFV